MLILKPYLRFTLFYKLIFLEKFYIEDELRFSSERLWFFNIMIVDLYKLYNGPFFQSLEL